MHRQAIQRQQRRLAHLHIQHAQPRNPISPNITSLATHALVPPLQKAAVPLPAVLSGHNWPAAQMPTCSHT